MDIDTGNSPPIASRPYTLPLKHYEWVRKEISTLERADIITKSISPLASPVVIVPKKSAPGEPPQRRMCVDFRKLNKRQPEVHNMNGGKGCISLVPTTQNRRTIRQATKSQNFLHIGSPFWILPHWTLGQC